MLRSQRYGITVSYELGKNTSLADLHSRAYLSKDAEHECEEFESVNIASYVPFSYQRLEEIRQETQKDKSLKVLLKLILQGWPDDKSSVLALALLYFDHRDYLKVQNGIVFRGERQTPRSIETEISLLTYGHRGMP